MNLTYPGGDHSVLPNGFQIGGVTIAFYAFCIIFGALIALLLSTYRARKDGHNIDFFLTIFIIAFPMGIIGARLWYVIAEWNYFISNLDKIFAIKDGGLAIQGGALLGSISGILYARFRRKGCNLLRCADYAVPTILVAQAIGRFGNFFNQEVYGHAVDPSAWSFLPSFIYNNMTGGDIGSSFVVPLFLVEGILNIGFYFIIVYLVEGVFSRWLKDGDLTFSYLISYGLIRMLLEPMRNPTYQMGNTVDKMNSLYMAIAFIVIGIVFIVLNHVLRYFDKKGAFKNQKWIDKLIGRESQQNNKVVATNSGDLTVSSNDKVTFSTKKESKDSKVAVDEKKLKDENKVSSNKEVKQDKVTIKDKELEKLKNLLDNDNS